MSATEDPAFDKLASTRVQPSPFSPQLPVAKFTLCSRTRRTKITYLQIPDSWVRPTDKQSKK